MVANALSRALRRLTSSEVQLRDEAHLESVRREGAVPLSECSNRHRISVRGVLKSVTIFPREDPRRWLEAEISDGSATLTLVWMGRHSIPGIEAGRTVRAYGRMMMNDGQRVMFNPRYELLS